MVAEEDRGVSAKLLEVDSVALAEESSAPFTDTYFCYQVVAKIASDVVKARPGYDEFIVLACSPTWLSNEWEAAKAAPGVFRIWDRHPGITLGSGFWFMEAWDEAEVENAVRTICERSSPAPDWRTLAMRIGRLIPWEFAGLE